MGLIKVSEEKFKVVRLPQDAETLQELLNQGYYVTKEYKAGDNIIVEMTSHSVQLVKLTKAIQESPELQQKVKEYLEKFGKK